MHLSDAAFQVRLERFGYLMREWGKAETHGESDKAEYYRNLANFAKRLLIHAYVTVRTEDDKAA